MPSRTKYRLTPEHEAQLKPWAERWIANALSTRPMDDEDRADMRVAIAGLYRAARLEPPPPERIVFVPSPLVGALAAGLAAAVWTMRAGPATEAATLAATEAVTEAATWAATWAATDAATRTATDTRAGAICARLAAQFGVPLGVASDHVRNAWRLSDSGNHGSGPVAFLSFFRHIAQLDLPEYEHWQHYEAAAIHGSWRWMHAQFCIVSDRPRVLRMDSRNRPHCADGPSHQWADGWSLWYWHGVRVPQQVIEAPGTITAEQIRAETNQEIRRVMLERIGHERALRLLGAYEVHSDQYGTLYCEPGRRQDRYTVVEVENGTPEPDGSRRRYFLSVPPTCKTALEAVAWTYGMTPEQYSRIERRT